MNPYIEIIRPGNAIMAVIAVILMGIVGHNYSIPIILSLIATFLALGGGNTINDVFDYKIDCINKPNRPIPSGRISLKIAKTYAYTLFIVAIIIGGIITYLVSSIWPIIIVAGACLLEYFYARNLKSSVLIGNITVGFLTGLCFIFGGTVIGAETNTFKIIIISLILGFFAILMTTAREIVKDIEDIEGDKEEGAKTFPIVYGKNKAAYLSSGIIIIDTILCPLLYIEHIFNLYYIIIVFFGMILFFYSGYKILKNQETKTCSEVSKNLKIGMMIAFIAFAIGSF
ncbi:geranylgeranylglycerol-phosphate geranylgeranyltransferase [Methanobrevibacter sp. 87.7]|uniref:UbiA family prenyltransferase n=1 Tax=Methanobrevibacter sp. 87.7 TaxID=387957 RepID=UPI000B5083F2|nr:UbiA family prenyltransferase [Methanobrevibacter sp. 87.7]OWT33189.1 geranylgeranylglycerol-phosphate geranylgeranyltransferase [Methanobrevibacter sp. 87.7]